MRKKVKRQANFKWKNQILLITIYKQNVSTNQFNTFNKLNFSCVCHVINILLTELSRSVCENLDLGCIRSVLLTSVKIVLYNPPVGLKRAKNMPLANISLLAVYKMLVMYEQSLWS